MDWELLEYFGEVLVFIGVVGEVFAEWREPERKKLAKSSSIVLVIGLALSLAALKGTNEHFTGTIADLRLKTSQANERATRNESIADGLKKDNLALEIELGKQEQQTSEARTEAAKAQIDLAKLEAPRKLTEAQQRDLIGELKPFSGTPIIVNFSLIDREAYNIGEQLLVVLQKAGWKIGAYGPFDRTRESEINNTIGITVSDFAEVKRGGIPIEHHSAKARAALTKALKKVGLLSKFPGASIVTDNPNQSVDVVVGRKP